MTVTKEATVDLHEKFTKVVKLITEDSKLDPENEPFKSKYSAREILLGMKNNLENLLHGEDDENQKRKFTAMLGSVYLYLGMVTIDTEEFSEGEKYLDKCNEIIKDSIENPEFIVITLNMYNQLGILWSQRDAEKSKSYLEKSEALYKKYKADPPRPPVDIADLFNPESQLDAEISWAKYEKVYTFTLYYLAQIYGVLKDTLKSTVYCHNTLKRQLNSKDYDPVDWALNAATLSQVFMEKNGFKQARHHLAASQYMLDKYEEELNRSEDRSEAFDAKYETFKHRSADVARCWAKYGLLLLSRSKERLLDQTEDIDKQYPEMCSDLSQIKLDENSTVSLEDLQCLEFNGLDLTNYESQITFKFILTIQDARHVFLNIQTWLRKAAAYYTLENLASDHVEIVQDQSQMYLNLLFFEESADTQAKLHKRRVDLLENIIKKINPQYYLAYCRQIWFELAQAYNDILNIKSDKLKETNERPTPHALTKINHLVESSIANFMKFIESFQDEKDVGEDYERAYLQAYFHVAALNSRFITLDKNVQLKNCEKTLEFYKKVVDYCDKNEKAKEVIPMEFGICKEMVGLLPVKIGKLRQEIGEKS